VGGELSLVNHHTNKINDFILVCGSQRWKSGNKRKLLCGKQFKENIFYVHLHIYLTVQKKKIMYYEVHNSTDRKVIYIIQNMTNSTVQGPA
jgi:hypothetical protein